MPANTWRLKSITRLTLLNGEKILVQEPAHEVDISD